MNKRREIVKEKEREVGGGIVLDARGKGRWRYTGLKQNGWRVGRRS